eukprot:218632-Rhodomonas_salina.1
MPQALLYWLTSLRYRSAEVEPEAVQQQGVADLSGLVRWGFWTGYARAERCHVCDRAQCLFCSSGSPLPSQSH